MKNRPFILLENTRFSYGARGFYKAVRDVRDMLDFHSSLVLHGFIGDVNNKIGVLAYKNTYCFGKYDVIQKTVVVRYVDKNGTIHNRAEYVFEEEVK